jgi:hypothetical protein
VNDDDDDDNNNNNNNKIINNSLALVRERNIPTDRATAQINDKNVSQQLVEYL